MNDQQINWTLIIIATIGAISAIVNSVLGYFGRKEINANVTQLEVKVDGKMEEYIKAVKGQSSAEGQLQERAAERAHLSDISDKSTHTTEDPLHVKLVAEGEAISPPDKKQGES